MNFKLVLKTYSQLRQLTDDETALLNTLRSMTDAEREQLAETLNPFTKAKVKPATTRTIEKCAGGRAGDPCGLTRRARVHKDATLDGYHPFQVPSAQLSSKSKHASSLAEKIAGTASGNHKPLLCSYEIDGKVCHGEEEDGIHDKSLGYGNYHPFVSSSSARSAVAQSSTSGSEASSGTGLVDVSSAAGG